MPRLSALAAGAAWILVWIHFLLAHGTTSRDEKEIVLGLTHNDGAKLLVVPLALAIPAVLRLRRRRGRAAAVAGLALLLLGVVLSFWLDPWGTYSFDDSTPVDVVGALLSLLGVLALAAGLVAQRGLAVVAGILLLPSIPWLHQTMVGVLPALGLAALALVARDRP